MSLGNPFGSQFGVTQEANRIITGFGALNNFGDSVAPDVNFVTGRGFPQDAYSVRVQISLIFVFTREAIIKQIQASAYRVQIGAAPGAERTTGTNHLYGRIVGLRGLGSNFDALKRMVFDPMQWSKDDAIIRINPAGLTGVDYEAAAGWSGQPVGRIFKWANANVFYDNALTQDGSFSWDCDIPVQENDILIMTPIYSDRVMQDTTGGLPLNVFCYAGSAAPVGGGTDYRTFQVLRTITISGDFC